MVAMVIISMVIMAWATPSFALIKEGHKWAPWEVTKEPTCTESGEETRVCTHIPNEPHNEVKILSPLGHLFGPWATVKKPTSESTGIEESVCERCGETEQRTIDMLPPEPVTKPDPEPTSEPTPEAVQPEKDVAETTPAAVKPPLVIPDSDVEFPINLIDIILGSFCLIATGIFVGLIRWDYKVIIWHRVKVRDFLEVNAGNGVIK
jgi:hypothetical protein